MKRPLASPMQYAWLAMEAQQVIALRMLKLAMGGAAAAIEAQHMVAEKVAAATKAAGMMCSATARGVPDGGSGAVVSMLRTQVRANRRRLARM